MVAFNTEKPFINISTPNSELSVALCFEASIKEKEWGVENLVSLADRLIKNGIRVVVIGKRPLFFSFEGEVGIINLTGRLNIAETVRELSKIQLLVTTDSGIMHIAYGLGISTVSLFGPGIEEKWAPKGKNHIIINKRLPCSPCTRFGYPLHVRGILNA